MIHMFRCWVFEPLNRYRVAFFLRAEQENAVFMQFALRVYEWPTKPDVN